MKGSEKGVKRSERTDAIVPSLPLASFHVFTLLFFFLLLPSSASSQISGLNALTVFDLASTSRTAGLGMDYLSVFGDDLTVAIDNPSLLHGDMEGRGVLSFVPMFAGSSVGSLTYAHNTGRLGTVAYGFHFYNYGRFDRYDEAEMDDGTFGAGDYALQIGWGMWLDSHFTFGVNFKPVLSQYEQYKALAVAFDVAASYVGDSRAFSATMMLRNVGAQIATFDGTRERLPFELSAALSYKLKNAPFRLFFAVTELQRCNLRYNDPLNPTSVTDPFTGEVHEEAWVAGFFDNLMRHTLFGVELNLGKSFYGRLGYSYRQSAEMHGVDAFNLSGFSVGMGIKTRRFEFGYSRRNYHLSQALNYLTLSYQF